jgi:type IV secretory pathway TrbD component
MRRILLHRSLWKPILYMGCERVPFLLIAISSALLIMEGNLWVKIGGFIYFGIMIGITALINNNDPFIFQIMWRYRLYQNFYPSHALYPGRPDNPKNF